MDFSKLGNLDAWERPPPRGRAVGLSSQRHDSLDSGEVWSYAARPHSGIRNLREKQGLYEMDPRPLRGGSPDVQVHEEEKLCLAICSFCLGYLFFPVFCFQRDVQISFQI